MHTQRLLQRCVQAWRRLADERSASLFFALQSSRPPEARFMRVVLRGWRRHTKEQQVWVYVGLPGRVGLDRMVLGVWQQHTVEQKVVKARGWVLGFIASVYGHMHVQVCTHMPSSLHTRVHVQGLPPALSPCRA